MNRVLILAVTASLLSAPMLASVSATALAAGSSTENRATPKTEAGLRCLLGLGPEGCEARFENPSRMRRAIRHCAGEDWSVRELAINGARQPECMWGALKSIEYLGTDSAGDDVYSTKFMHTDDTHILPPPGPNGKIARDCWVHGNLTNALRGMCSDSQAFATSSVQVTLPPEQGRILYARTAQ